MTTTNSLAALAAALAIFAPLAHADDKMGGGHMEGGPMGGRMEAAFKKADTDNDGTLTKDEAKAMPRVAKNFDAIDTDKDGTVSLDEVRASMKNMGKKMHDRGVEKFKAADKDKDGTLTKEEAKAMPHVAKNFDAIDADKDGTVSAQEIHDYMKAQHGMKGPAK